MNMKMNLYEETGMAMNMNMAKDVTIYMGTSIETDTDTERHFDLQIRTHLLYMCSSVAEPELEPQ
jgi:hypothetical protein